MKETLKLSQALTAFMQFVLIFLVTDSPKVNHESPGLPKMYKTNSNAHKEEPHSGSAGSNKSK